MIIKDKTFVVTGAARGFGFEIARNLVRQQANVMLVDLNDDDLQHALEIIKQDCQPSQVAKVAANVAIEQDVITAFDKTIEAFGALDGLVNNAGILRDGLLLKVKDGQVIDQMSLEQWQAVVDVNLTGVFLCGREAAKKMIETKSKGVIINISSIARAGNFGQSNYAAAKSGVVALSVTWAKELARFGIRVAAIAPGVFGTEMVKAIKPEAYDKLVAMIPLKRTGEIDELSSAVQFILENDYFTGRTLELDGGMRM